MADNNLVNNIMDSGVDVLQVFISTSAVFGIGLLWINFNEKVFKTVLRLAAAPFSWPNKDCGGDEEEEE